MKTVLQTLFFFLLVMQICLAQWYQQNSGTTRNLNAVHFVDANTGWAVGDSGTILHTTNAGTNWEQQMSGTTAGLRDMIFTNELNGWTVGLNDSWQPYSVLLRTTDAGLNWIQKFVDTSLIMESVFFLNESFGWIGGTKDTAGSWEFDTPVILRTTNGGTDWELKFITQGSWGERINDVYFLNNNIGYAAGGICHIVGCDGHIYKTTNGGETWNRQIDTYSAQSIIFFDLQSGLVAANCGGIPCGNTGNILRTQDGGISWAVVYEPSAGDTTVRLRDITFYETVSVWAVGESHFDIGKILFSSDLGENWTSQGVFSNALNSVDFINSTSGWAVGCNGIILHTTNGGVTFVEEGAIDETPTEFLLSQNYPNPFNPSTNIQYAVSSTQFVTFKVYDVLGREIAILVNEEKEAGYHSIDFNGSDLTSGVYFYRIQSGNFIDTKKMILLR